MDFTKNKYKEYAYINGKEVNIKVFEREFDIELSRKNKKLHGELVKRVLEGEKVKLGRKIFYYEERDVITGDIKVSKY
jgi:hypothetical protein